MSNSNNFHQVEYEQIKKELAEIEEQYNKLCKERDEIVAEDKRQQDELMIEQEKIRHLYHAASVIQRWWKDTWRRIANERKLQSRTTGSRRNMASRVLGRTSSSRASQRPTNSR